MIKFHEQFSKILDIMNLSGNGVARSLGANQGLVNRYRTGLTAPPIEFAQKFCEHYGVSANWLLLNIEPVMINDLVSSSSDVFIKSIVNKKEFGADLDKVADLITELQKKHGL